MPPSRAMLMAALDSVTVSMAALTTGMLSAKSRVRRVLVLQSLGRMSE